MTYSIALNTHEQDVTALVYRAERYLASLVGCRLALVASWVSDVADAHSADLVSCDRQGERIVGAAAVTLGIHVVDTSRRLDGRRVVLVGGALAGPIGMEHTAMTLRSLGAAEVHCAWVTGWAGEINAANSSTRFDEGRSPEPSTVRLLRR